jgi:sugar phosphate isomerase/epimerase
MGFSDITTIHDFLQFVYKKDLTAVELVAEPPNCFIGDFNQSDRIAIKRLANDLQLELTLHASYADINIAALNPDVHSRCVDIVKKSLEFAADIGATVVTVHPGNHSVGGIYYLEKVKEINFNSIEKLVQYAKELNVKIGYENLPIMPWELLDVGYQPVAIREFIEKINVDNLGITWDIGHSNTTEYSLEEYFNNFKDYLIHLHLHDNNGYGSGWLDTHTTVGKGTTNWELLFKLLNQINYQNTCVLEVSNKQKIDESLDFLATYL